MRLRIVVAGLAALLAVAGAAQPAAAQSDQPSIDLVVNTGRPLRVALDQRIKLKSVGQAVTGLVTEPVYAYDRIVIAVGTRVRGHVMRIDSGSKFVRARAYLGGNFSPTKHVVPAAAALALARASNPHDEIFVLNFNDKARIDVPFTSEVGVLEAGIGRVDAIGGTAMRDAVDIAQTYLSAHATRDRKVLLVITDGIDNSSVATRDRIEKQAEQGDTVIFAVGLFGTEDRAKQGRHELDQLADGPAGWSITRRASTRLAPSPSRSRGRSGISTRSPTRR